MPDWNEDLVNTPCPILQGDPWRRVARGELQNAIHCMVSGCGIELDLKYLKRFRLCREHIRSLMLLSGDQPLRFCQRCNKLQPLEDFIGDHRSCKWMGKRPLSSLRRRAKVPVTPRHENATVFQSPEPELSQALRSDEVASGSHAGSSAAT
ncbi:unnamed protein product [Ostreobium quekettii]|uniref:SBP-type domain-containing protein n=1 Tax=Ostreobium quekettii TaxID=121088 RepID=A0A8S1IZS8_9CHLO|nr:unnamed protein product [Ostreobium quekettii]|eukprot:evm.model.scf_395.6 EVM.evm.TU.scf_395.6   scf_395:65535-67013(-)